MTLIDMQAHAGMDLRSRRWKAEKIARLLDLDSRPGRHRILEIGSGSRGSVILKAAFENERSEALADRLLFRHIPREAYTKVCGMFPTLTYKLLHLGQETVV